VAVNDINPINLEATVTQIHAAGGKAQAYVFDVAKRMPIEAMLSKVTEELGRVDFLVNHASVQPDACLLDMDEWEFHRTLDVNLGGPFFCMQQVGRLMREQGGGVMVNIVSNPPHAQKGHAAYVASQAGLIGLTRFAASELSAYNIRVNALYFGSSGMDLVLPQASDSVAYRQWLESLPMTQLGDLKEPAVMVLYLCSQAASDITGQVISVVHYDDRGKG